MEWAVGAENHRALPLPGNREGRLPGWQLGVGEQDDRDLALFGVALVRMLRDFRAESRRVYGVGHSNGGRFAQVLLAARGEQLTAVAASASVIDGLLDGLEPKPYLRVAGKSDRLVPLQRWTMEAVRRLNGLIAIGA